MNITQFGTVDLDPSEVPTSKLTSQHRDNGFEERLQSAERRQQQQQQFERIDARNPQTTEESGPAVDNQVPETPETVEDLDSATPDESPQTLTDEPRTTVPAAQTPVSEPTGGPSKSTARTNTETTTTTVTGSHRNPTAANSQVPAQTSAPTNQVLTVGVAATTSTAPSQASQTTPVAQATAPRLNINKPAAIQATQPSHSTHLLQTAEQAKDSIFKQIHLRLTQGGGEMMVRLDPPELGKLDMNLVVERGAVVRLTIHAERAEVLMMLDKHMQELKQTLTEQGFDMGGAEVRTGLQQRHEQSGESHSPSSDPANTGSTEQPATSQPTLVFTGEGLNFLV